jgi:hypothetical protein
MVDPNELAREESATLVRVDGELACVVLDSDPLLMPLYVDRALVEAVPFAPVCIARHLPSLSRTACDGLVAMASAMVGEWSADAACHDTRILLLVLWRALAMRALYHALYSSSARVSECSVTTATSSALLASLTSSNAAVLLLEHAQLPARLHTHACESKLAEHLRMLLSVLSDRWVCDPIPNSLGTPPLPQWALARAARGEHIDLLRTAVALFPEGDLSASARSVSGCTRGACQEAITFMKSATGAAVSIWMTTRIPSTFTPQSRFVCRMTWWRTSGAATRSQRVHVR